jgi:hypothetical protein
VSVPVPIQAPKADITVRVVLGPIIALCCVNLTVVVIIVVVVLSTVHKVNLANWLLLLQLTSIRSAGWLLRVASTSIAASTSSSSEIPSPVLKPQLVLLCVLLRR